MPGGCGRRRSLPALPTFQTGVSEGWGGASGGPPGSPPKVDGKTRASRPCQLVDVEGGAWRASPPPAWARLSLPLLPRQLEEGETVPALGGAPKGPAAAGLAPRDQMLCTRAGSKLGRDGVGCGRGS